MHIRLLAEENQAEAGSVKLITNTLSINQYIIGSHTISDGEYITDKSYLSLGDHEWHEGLHLVNNREVS